MWWGKHKKTDMITEKYLEKAIEQAEFNCSGEHVDYNITCINELSEKGAYLVFAESDGGSVQTSFVAYENGTCYFLSDWQGAYPTNEDEIQDYNDWVTIDWQRLPVLFNGLPRRLL